MADSKISQLTPVTGANLLDGDELVVARASTLQNFSVTRAELFSSTPPISTDSLTATTADINGGTIDGTVIGGSTPAAISGTTGSFSGNLTVNADVVISDPLPVLTLIDSDGTNQFIQILQSAGSAFIDVRDGAGFGDLRIRGNNGSSVRNRVLVSDGGDISFYEDTGTTPKFFWDASTERLGIGNAAPTTALDVTGTITADRLTVSSSASNIAVASVTNTDTLNGNGLFLKGGGSNSGKYTLLTQNAAGATNLKVDNNGDISFYEDTGTTPKFFWDASAESLGIGTTAPAFYSGKLTVAGGNIAIEGGNRALFWNTGGTGIASIQGVSTNELSFSTSNSFTERMRITSTGNVGIGTSSPDERLVVAGDIKLTGASYVHFTNTSDTVSVGAAASSILRINSNAASGRIEFQANGSERARIDASGNLLVGTNVAEGSGGTSIQTGGIITTNRGTTTLAAHHIFKNPNGTVGSITTEASATAFNTSSDYRLKEDVQPMSGAPDRVLALNPVNFAWKVDGTRVDGFLAHEAQEVVPAAVTGEKDGEEMQAIDHSKLVPLLTAALQEALQKIDEQKAALEALEARITALEA